MSLGLGGVCRIETDSSSKNLEKLLLKNDIIKGETIKGTTGWYKLIM
jgi:hypothetical protein